jgi:regulator of sigma E protease
MMAAAGMRSGDRVVAASEDETDGPDAAHWRDVRSFEDLGESLAVALMDRKPLSLKIRRDGEQGTQVVSLPLDTLGKNELDQESVTRIGLTAPYSPAAIAEVVPGGPAARAGVQAGDVVDAIDGEHIVDAVSLLAHIRASAADGSARTMQWQVLRAGKPVALVLTPRVVAEDTRHFGRVDAAIGGKYAKELVDDGLLDSMAYGAQQTWYRSVLSLRMFGRMLVGKASVKNLNGPISIADAAGQSAKRGLADFLAFLASVSVGIGVLNLLPVPVLDGGRLLYYLFEGATGRPVSTPWQTWLRYGGVFAILLLMSLALSNDLARFLGR